MKFCANCKGNLSEDMIFCPKCGTKVVQESENTTPQIMFCAKCGYKMESFFAFCPKCGIKTAFDGSGQIPSAQQPVFQQIPVTLIKNIKSLRVLSIIGFIWYPLSLLSFYNNPTLEQVFSFSFIIFGYAIAHAIVSIVQGSKNGINILKVMGIIGIIWFVLSYIFIVTFASEGELEAYIGWVFLGLGYALAFSIVVFVNAKISIPKIYP
jgi:RNA polymerase subunit RPABC4/transcription elongation factor Spt4